MSVATRQASPPGPEPTARPAPPPDAPSSFVARIAEALATWGRRQGVRPDAVVDEFTSVVAEEDDPGAVDSALVRLACRAAGPSARRVELLRDFGRGPRRVAAWPNAGADLGCADLAIDLPLRCGGRGRGTLRVSLDPLFPLAPDRRRRLATLAVLAAAADRGRDASPAPSAASPTHDAATGLLNGAFFAAFLTYAAALARRRDEPIALLAIEVDRLGAIRDLHGPGLAAEALRKVGRAIAANLRSSDVIARLDDGRLVVALPNTTADGAMSVAEAVRLAVSVSGGATETMPVLTASVGVAAFPEHAGDEAALLAAATAALASARSGGRDRIAEAPPAEPASRLRIAQHAG